MKLACSTSAFKTDLETAVAKVAEAGFEYIDVIAIGAWDHVNVPTLTEGYDAESSRVITCLAKHSLTPIAMNCGVKPTFREPVDAEAAADRRNQAHALARLMKQLGVSVAGFYPGFFDPQYFEWEECFDNLVAAWTEMMAIASEEGVTFILEPHFRTPIDTTERVHKLFEALPEAEVTYDPTHFIHGGESLEETAFMLEHARHIHLRNASPEKIHAPLAEGTVDFEKLIKMIHDSGYTGNASIEYLPGVLEDPLPELREFRQRLLDFGL